MSEFVFKSLREDIDLFPGTRGLEGLPTYVLHDRWRNKFVNIGWLEFEMLKRWHLRDPMQIAEAVNQETTLYAEPEDVAHLTEFLVKQELTIETQDASNLMKRGSNYVTKKAESRIKLNPMAYLMFRIPLIHPDRFLEATLWMVRPLMTRTALFVNLVILSVSLILVLQQFHTFTGYVNRALSLEGAFYLFFALAISKSVHEFGHAYTCKRYGLRVASMGMMWMIIFPFLYTDTTESWKLESRKKRIAIGSAGVLAEMQLATIATLLWTLLPDGAFRYACFYLATAAWIATLMINLSPFLRWDGYWVLSDLVGIQNLRERSNTACEWWFGKTVMGFEDECSVKLPPKQIRFCVIFAVLSWFYRIGIFLAIAAMLFEKMPKVLGIYAFIMMVVGMVLKPILLTSWSWLMRWRDFKLNTHSAISLGLIGLVLLALFIPWRSSIVVPGVIAPRQHNEIYAGVAGKVVSVPEHGQWLARGETLYELENRELNFELEQSKADLEYYKVAMQRAGSGSAFKSGQALAREQLKVATSQYLSVARQVQRLHAKAPYAGQVVWVNEMAKQRGFVNTDKPILTYIDPNSSQLYAYIGEYDLQRLNQTGDVRFYPENPFYAPIDGNIIEVDTANVPSLDYEILSSTTGGPITAVKNNKSGKLEPLSARYLVRIEIAEGERKNYPIMVRGRVLLEGERRSYASWFFDSMVGTIIRESGF